MNAMIPAGARATARIAFTPFAVDEPDRDRKMAELINWQVIDERSVRTGRPPPAGWINRESMTIYHVAVFDVGGVLIGFVSFDFGRTTFRIWLEAVRHRSDLPVLRRALLSRETKNFRLK